MSYKAISVAALGLALSSCSSVHFYKVQPEKMYEGARPLSDTAVFSAHDELSAICPLGADVQMVDGRATSRLAFPIWVRVAPGSHDFVVNCNISASLGFHVIHRVYATLQVKISDMKPRHVYVAHYDEAAGKIAITADDLGDTSYYAIQLGGQLVTPDF